MSFCSDDTDVLLLIPPDVFAIADENTEKLEGSNNLQQHMFYLEERIKHLEAIIVSNSMRRFGSVDALTPTPRSSYLPRSLQATPLKLRNMLNSEPYVTQKLRDDESLREIDEYFKNRNNPVPEEAVSQGTGLDVDVQNILLEAEQTQRAVLGQLSLDEIGDNSSRTEDSKRARSIRRSLTFDSPKKTDTVRERNECEISVSNCVSDSKSNGFSSDVGLLKIYTDNATKQTSYEESLIVRQRLEEERCRRRHCEGIIQDLQKSLLEKEEKLAVALKSDGEKGSAIKKLRDGWSKVMERLKEVDCRHAELSSQLVEEREKFLREKEILTSSNKRYEMELSKALDLAHGYKEKCEAAVKDHKTTLREKDDMRLEFEEAQDLCRSLEENIAKLNDVVAEKEEALNQSRSKLSELSVLIKDLKKQVKTGQVDKERLQQERNSKSLLQNKLDEALKRESLLEEQVRSITKSKTDLKQYYQDQVEHIVGEKQKEFQAQLVNAEKALQKQFDGKEKAIEDLSRAQIQQLAEKHKVEVALIEEKHSQEVKLVEIRLSQKKEKIEDLQRIICERTSFQQDLAEKLHGVIENQWKETLRLISISPKSSVERSGLPVLKRQNTFTLGDDSCGKPSRELRRQGSMTYRVDETPINIPTEMKSKDFSDVPRSVQASETDDSLFTSRLDHSASFNRTSSEISQSRVSLLTSWKQDIFLRIVCEPSQSSTRRYSVKRDLPDVQISDSSVSKESGKYCSASSKPPWK